jgi:hypothetical protein
MLARAAAQPPLEFCSLLEFEPERLYQGFVGSCVSVGSKGMFLDYCAANGLPRLELSERALYWQARVLEYLEQAPDADGVRERVAAEGDTGAYPWLAWQAWRELGLVPYEDCPGREPVTAEECETFVRIQPAPRVFASGYERRGLEAARLQSTGLDKVRELAALLQHRVPVGFGMSVDLTFGHNEGEVIRDLNPHLIQGGHWMRIVAVLKPGAAPAGIDTEAEAREWLRSREETTPAGVTPDHLVVVLNTWRNWGLHGFGLIQAEFWAGISRDATGLRWLPEAA